MKFLLKTDKLLTSERGGLYTFLESGSYDVVRLFDAQRVMVKTNHGRPDQLTLLNLKDGELSI